MNSTFDFLNALFGSYEGALRFDLDDEIVESGDPDFITRNASKLRVYPHNASGVFFVYGFVEGVERDSFEACRVHPTVTLFRNGNAIFCWAFADEVSAECLLNSALLEKFEYTDAIPLPGVGGWEVVDCDPEAVFPMDDLRDAYFEGPVTDAEVDASLEDEEDAETTGLKKYGDAVVHGDYDASNYEQTVIVTIGARRDSRDWRPTKMPLAALIGTLCQHKVDKNKDGMSVVFADMVPGQRLKNSVKTIMGIGLDIDNGTPLKKIIAALKGTSCLAVLYTTHSHNKTSADFKKDKVLKHYPDEEIDSELMRRFCSTVEHWDPSIADTVEYLEQDHTTAGIVVRIEHKKMPKCRVFIPLRDLYEIDKEGKTQLEAMARWARYPAALADALKVPFDRSCTDPSRLFYLPRHKDGSDFEVHLFPGPLFDRAALHLDGEFDQMLEEVGKSGGKTKTPEGKELGRWSNKTAHGFQIVNVIEDHASDGIRGTASMGVTIECPFDEDHSNAGDTSDRACYAVNAAEGGNELFIIKCQHEGCKDKTMLDMLGKMVKDGWFARSAIYDPDYNAAKPDKSDQMDAEVAEKSRGNPPSNEIDEMVNRLTTDSDDDEIERALTMLLDFNLSALRVDRVLQKMTDKTKRGISVLKKTLVEIRDQAPAVSLVESPRIEKRLNLSRSRPFEFPSKTFGAWHLAEVDGRPWMYRSEGDGKGGAVTTPFVLVGSVTYPDRNGDRAIRVEVLNAEDRWIKVEFDAGLLAQSSGAEWLGALKRAGLSWTPGGKDFLQNYLCATQFTGPTVYHTPGWRAGAFISPTGEALLTDEPVELADDMKLKCKAKAGSLEEWMRHAEALFSIADAYHLHAGVLIGWAGTLSGLSEDDTLCYSFEGLSTHGKSTSQALAAAHYADPSLGVGLFHSSQGTANSQEYPLQLGSCTVTCLDEVRHIPEQSQHDLIFTAQAGVAKRRLSKSSTARQPRTWVGGALMYSAETPFAERMKAANVKVAGGLTVRILSISTLEAPRLSEGDWVHVEGMKRNFGWSGPAFIHGLAKQGYVENPTKVGTDVDLLIQSLPGTEGPENAQRRRAARNIAYPWLAGMIAQKAGMLPMSFDVEGWANRLWRSALASDLAPVDPAERDLVMLFENLGVRKGSDIIDWEHRTQGHHREVVGYYNCKVRGEQVYAVRTSKVQLLSGGTAPLKALTKLLEERGYLVRSEKEDSRTWSGLPGLGKEGQYLVIRSSAVDGPE